MMDSLLRRQTRILCFFCQTTLSPPPPQPLSFLCPHCGCWNRYDANGDILSDDPAMHDETLNRNSFARRASPRKDRLLTTFGAAPFCTTCQSNQRLVLSLLSSYLPPSDDDPDYAPRLAGFPAYKASMYARYPPVCERCAPLVEDEIRKKDVMARSDALGSWLNESKKNDTRRQVSLSSMDRYKLNRELRWWTARGILWVATLLGTLFIDLAGSLGHLTLPERYLFAVSLPVFIILSLFWTAWLPTYASFRRAELQGRKVRVQGRERYVALQAAVWVLRMFTAGLITVSWRHPSMDYLSLRSRPGSVGSRIFFSFASCFELFAALYSVLTLRLHRPPAVRLIDTSTSRASTPSIGTASRTSSPPPPHTTTTASSFSRSRTFEPPELLDNLSLSAAPIPLRTWHAAGPVFGHPSLRPATFLPPSASSVLSPVPVPPTLSSSSQMSQSRDTKIHSRGDEDDDVMDWTPTVSPVRQGPVSRGLFSVRTAADATTGLEMLLERTNIDSSEPVGVSVRVRRRADATKDTSRWSWGWVYTLSLIPLVGMIMLNIPIPLYSLPCYGKRKRHSY
ncbi:Ima1 N-terminal domain-containing protein [Multifurca ochricompacta]|uniref:Ima1 N-terminal domain-containing protein n=1 Tax=Multifurca ochricompacta TaxID=376703 RepID=A0AAD4MF12_9AGAM|nr:Ima1 N-terminal domain-containing protein [Multifurca ochricompacta]